MPEKIQKVTYSRRQVMLLALSLFIPSSMRSSQAHPKQPSPEFQILPPRQLQYDIDAQTISEMVHRDQINILMHSYAAVIQDGEWVVHAIGEHTLHAAALLFEHIIEQNPDCQITVLMGASIPYGDKMVSQIYGKRLYELVGQSNIPLGSVHIIDHPSQVDEEFAGFSTSGELDYAHGVFGDEFFFSIAPLPHIERILQLVRNKEYFSSAISIDGIMFYLERYNEVEPLVREYWFRFTLTEAVKRLFIARFDKKGEYLESRARIKRSERPPPSF